MKDFRYMAIVAAAALGLAVAGCGSSGSDGPSTETPAGPTQAEQIATLQGQINALRAQLGLPADGNLGDSITALQDKVTDLEKQIADAADDDKKKADEARIVEAAKLYAGISAQMGDGDLTSFAATDRDAGYNAAGTAILVSIGDGSGTAHTEVTATLSEDKKTTVADNHGWAGKRYVDPAGGDSVEAVVYSNVEAPKMGRKFGSSAVVTTTGAFEYQLATAVTDATAALQSGEVTVDTSGTGVPARVALTGVTRTAGTETFKFSADEITDRRIDVPGSFHGVSGTYYCTPTTRASGCTASVAARGFTLEAGTWAFKPGDPNARVMSAPDAAYASYGWWLRKAANNGPFTASAFVDDKGVDQASGNIIDALNGTAKYVGGAAGKYALSSATGGTNDAGHFTARATLEADFTNNTAATAIDGTIDMIRGADGELRPWSVKLNGSPIANDGTFGDDTNGTEWTIGETAADDAGQWSGSLRENGTDGVPQVATGTFYSTYGTAGRMVGAFGANKQ